MDEFEFVNQQEPVLQAILTAMEAEGLPRNPGVGEVYHCGLDTGIRFAVANPELARRFLNETAAAMSRTGSGEVTSAFDKGANALTKAVGEWR